MDVGIKKVFKNISYTFCGNVLSLLVTAFVTFVIPKYLGVEQYSYYQLFTFYASYVGFFHFGWLDGIYLQYGGAYYKDLDKQKLGTQFRIFCVFEILIAIIFGILGININSTIEKQTIFLFIALFIIIALPTTFFQYILQCTNRIRENAFTIVIDKSIYFILTILLLFNTASFEALISVNLIGKAIALSYAAYKCKDIVLAKAEVAKVKNAILEAIQSTKIGMNLMFANIAGMLLVGVVKFAIEQQWDVTTFGKISLTMSVSNMLMVAIRAIALVIFPVLRRIKESKLKLMYDFLRTALMVVLMLMLVAYYPIKELLTLWLPQYADSLKYMALLFPICIYECKMSMLIETYLKTLREEKKLLKINIISLILSVILTIILVYGIKNLDLVMCSIVFIYATRCIMAEKILASKLDININKDIVMEVLMTCVFMTASWCVGGIKGFVIYLLAYIIYIILHLKKMNILVR